MATHHKASTAHHREASDAMGRKYSAAYKAAKRPLRPLGIVLILVFYCVFSAIGLAGLFIEGDMWWIFYLGASLLIAYLFRGLWWGDERERQIGVFLGFLFAAFEWAGFPENMVSEWTFFDFSNIAEGVFFFLAACYLLYMRKHRFFASPE